MNFIYPERAVAFPFPCRGTRPSSADVQVPSRPKEARVNRMTMGFAACLAAVVTAGCGTVTASQAPGSARHGPAAGCPGGVPAQALTITLAGNGKTYCVRVGEKL